MSFIFQDQQLVDFLISQGQATTPATPYVGVGPQDFAAMRGVVDNLEQQLKGPEIGAGPEVRSAGGAEAALSSPNLENLGTLVEFLATNKMMLDGKRIAYALNEEVRDPSYQLYKLQGAAGLLEPADRTETVTRGYRLNRDLLTKYIGTLQAQLAKTPNPPMQAQLNGIIQQANEQLDANVSSVYKEPSKTLPPTQKLDDVPQNLNTQSPAVDGNIPLTYGDLASDTAFNAWIQHNNIGIDGKAFRHPEYNKCALISSLYQRSQQKLNNAASEQEKYMYTVYVEQVPRLAGVLRCDLGEAARPGAMDKQKEEPTGATQQTASLQQIVSTLPLQLDSVDFGRIRNFLNTYRAKALSTSPIFDPTQKERVATLIQQLESYMSAAQQNTVGGALTNFHMDGLTAQDLINWATPPSPGQATRSRGSAVALADYLYYIVQNTGALIQNLLTSHATPLSQYPELRQAIEQQAGGTHIPFGSSIAAANLNNIRAARSRLPVAGVA